MRMLFLTAAILGVATTGAAQQTPQPGRGRAMLFAGIDFTPAQQARLDSLWAAHEREMAPIHERMRADPADTAVRGARDLMHERMMARVRVELTPEQQVVFDRNRARMEAMRGMGRGPGMGPGGPPATPPPAHEH